MNNIRSDEKSLSSLTNSPTAKGGLAQYVTAIAVPRIIDGWSPMPNPRKSIRMQNSPS